MNMHISNIDPRYSGQLQDILHEAPKYCHPEVLIVLSERYARAKRDQMKKGVRFDLTFDQFMTLVGAGKRKRIDDAIKSGDLKAFFRSQSGYCLTWVDRKAYRAKHMTVDTAEYVTRRKSRRVNQFDKTDTHSEESKAQISLTKTGKKQKAKTKAAISASLMGHEVSAETREKQAAKKRGTTKTPEERARIAETMRATLAAKRAAKEAAL